MALNTTIGNAAALAACDGIVDLIDAGSGAGKLRIYSGTQPTNPDVAITDQTLLAELTFGDPAFGAAADGTPGGVATANSITADSSANASGTATWFRAVDSDDNAIFDGTVGTSGANLNLDSVSITAGQSVSVSSLTFTMPETPS